MCYLTPDNNKAISMHVNTQSAMDHSQERHKLFNCFLVKTAFLILVVSALPIKLSMLFTIIAFKKYHLSRTCVDIHMVFQGSRTCADSINIPANSPKCMSNCTRNLN